MSEQRTNGSRRALLISASLTESGVSISLDDVVNANNGSLGWAEKEHVTTKELDKEALREMNFDQQELADFGHYVLARLSVFVDRGEA